MRVVDGDGVKGSHQDTPHLGPQVLPPGTAMDWVLRAALEAHAAKRLPTQVPVGEYLDEHSGFIFHIVGIQTTQTIHPQRTPTRPLILQSPRDVDSSSLQCSQTQQQHGQVVPHFFVGHEKMPLAPGGKVDRQALMAVSNEEPNLEPLTDALEVGPEIYIFGSPKMNIPYSHELEILSPPL